MFLTKLLKYFHYFWKETANKPFYKQRKKKVVKRNGRQIGFPELCPKSIHILHFSTPHRVQANAAFSF